MITFHRATSVSAATINQLPTTNHQNRLFPFLPKATRPSKELVYVDVQSGGGLETIRFANARNLVSIARTIQKAGVRKVVAAEYSRMRLLDQLCEKMGIALEHLTVRPKEVPRYLGSLKERSMIAVIDRFEEKRDLPDLLLFTDDYVAFGGLVGLATCPVRIPDEMRVLTLSNVGFEPVFPVSLAQILVDPRANGAAIAAKALACIENRPFQESLPMPKIAPGASFPL